MDSQRRGFLKTAAMAAASSLVLSDAKFSLPVLQAETELSGGDAVTWNKAPCRFCGTGCHVQVGVLDGRVVAIAGDKAADVNKGLLCVKGYHVGGILYGNDRLTKPLLKRDGVYVEIDWSEAIDIIAQRIFQAPERFAFYGSGQWTIPEGYAAQKMIKGGLSNNHIDPNAGLCMASAVTGYLSAYGVDQPAGPGEARLDVAIAVGLGGADPLEHRVGGPVELEPAREHPHVDHRLRRAALDPPPHQQDREAGGDRSLDA